MIYLVMRETRKQATETGGFVTQLYEKIYDDSDMVTMLTKHQKSSLGLMIGMYLVMGFIMWMYMTMAMFHFGDEYGLNATTDIQILGFTTILIKSWVGFAMVRTALDDLSEIVTNKRMTPTAQRIVTRIVVAPVVVPVILVRWIAEVAKRITPRLRSDISKRVNRWRHPCH